MKYVQAEDVEFRYNGISGRVVAYLEVKRKKLRWSEWDEIDQGQGQQRIDKGQEQENERKKGRK